MQQKIDLRISLNFDDYNNLQMLRYYICLFYYLYYHNKEPGIDLFTERATGRKMHQQAHEDLVPGSRFALGDFCGKHALGTRYRYLVLGYMQNFLSYKMY